MPKDKTTPSGKKKSVVTSTILSGEQEVSKQYHLLSIIVTREVNEIPTATLVYKDGDPGKHTFELSGKNEFEPGKEIEIKAGYKKNEKTIFKGIVLKHNIRVTREDSFLLIECRDKAVRMTAACKSKNSHDRKDSEIIEELIGYYCLENDVASTSVIQKQIVQYNCTDWNFMLCRADVNGFLCIVNDGHLSLAPPDFNGDPVLTIDYGAGVYDLDAEIDSRLQFKSVKGTSWNYTDQELQETESRDPVVPDAGNLSAESLADVLGEREFRLYNSAKIEEPEMQAWVNAAMMKNRLAKVRGKVTTGGTAAVLPGNFIRLKGVGDRFEGKLFVSGVRHELNEGVWLTTFQFGINPEWFAQTYNVQQPLSGAMLPAIQGLQIGVVTKLENDPEGEDRIMVKVPIVSNNVEGTWCRISTLDAGNKRGSFFRPEIGDEVIVGFINNDPRHAVVLGMLNSSAKPAPLKASDENNEKGFVSRSEIKTIFNDGKKSYSVETPAGNKFLMTEEKQEISLKDQHGNKITMNSEGIKIESVKDIILGAGGDIKAEGVDIRIEGKSYTKIEGVSGVELSSSAVAKIEGALVSIN